MTASLISRLEVTAGQAISSTSRVAVNAAVTPTTASGLLSRVEVTAISSSSLTSRLSLYTVASVASGLLSRVEVLSAQQNAISSTSRVELTASAVNATSQTSRMRLEAVPAAVTGQLSRLEVSIQGDASSYTSKLILTTAPLAAIIQPITQAAYSRSNVILDGGSSAGSPNTFSWVQVSGTPVVINNPNVSRTFFTVPPTVAGDTLVFKLTASVSGASDSDTVTVQILPQISWYASGGTWIPVQLKTVG